jgi:hypothetical protein
MNLFIESATIFLLIARFIHYERWLHISQLPLQRLLLAFEILNRERESPVSHEFGIPEEEEGDLELRHLADTDCHGLSRQMSAQEIRQKLGATAK